MSTFFIFSIKGEMGKIINPVYVFQSLINDRKHLIMAGAITLFVLLALLMMCFEKRISPASAEMLMLTPKISIPKPAGNGQFGAARFLTDAEQKRYFEHVTMFKDNPLIHRLIEEGKKDFTNIENGELAEIKCLPESLLDVEKAFKSGIPISFSSERGYEDILILSGDINTACYGSTRCGKTRTVVLQALAIQALAGHDTFNSDPKGEIYLYTFPFLKRLGGAIFALNFKNPKQSCHINYLQYIVNAINENDISRAIQCCWDIAENIVSEPKTGEPIWTNGEKALLAAACMQVVYDNSPAGLKLQFPEATEEEIQNLYETKHKDFQNCTNLFYYIAKSAAINPLTENMYFTDILSTLPPTHPAALILSIVESAPERTRGSFITSALTSLKLFTDPAISHITRDTTPGLLELGSQKHIFMILPDDRKTYYPLASLFTTQYYQYLSIEADKKGGRLDRDCEFNIDEAGNFTKMSNIDNMVTVGPGRGIHFYFYLQSKEQFVEKYGAELSKVILDNCHYLIYLKSGDDTAKYISENLHTYTIKSVSSSSSVNDKGSLFFTPHGGSSSSSTQFTGRSLLMPDEVIKIERPYLLIIDLIKGFPSLTKSPDISKWYFNTMFGLGSEEHNRKLRIYRENMCTSESISPLKLWDVKEYVQGLVNKKAEKIEQEEELNRNLQFEQIAKQFMKEE